MKHFKINCTNDNGNTTYTFKTIDGKEFAKGVAYEMARTNKKYIAVKTEPNAWTLYNHKGESMKGAKDVRFISWNEKDYSVNIGNEDEKTYIFPEYKAKLIRKNLTKLGALAIAITATAQIYGCYQKDQQEKNKYENTTQMTYLGLSNGFAMFDTDGNKQTAEVVSYTLSAREIGCLYGQEGQTQTIAKWKETTGMRAFQNTRQK
ncbi:MAG: hypothetical protein IJO11_03770 [Alphaproteobacteria bacterium]|nr:hypothetical protein [Alphaproteobacteria bacterium]